MVLHIDDEDIPAFLADKHNVAELLPQEITIEGLLAQGGQGIVYRGQVSGVDAAVKIYFPGQLRMRIDREIEALSKLDNPHIVKLHWAGQIIVGDTQLPLVATSLIAGEDLSTHTKNNPMSHEQIGTVIYDITDAIRAMWVERIVHRDLKPPNILLMPNGCACVIDLGVARHIDMTPLTATGFTWGTQGYMSPEQTKAIRQLTCKSDVFGLGVIAVECAMGRHPTRQDQLRLLSMGLHERLPIELASWDYAPLVQDMLHPRPTKRPDPSRIQELLSVFAPE